jgi:hypothetical protein
MIKTAEQICAIAEKKSQTVLGQRRVINRLFRAQDDSDKWPINGRFSVVDRAIRKARWFEGQSDMMSSLEYALFLEAEESRIVNDPRNM